MILQTIVAWNMLFLAPFAMMSKVGRDCIYKSKYVDIKINKVVQKLCRWLAKELFNDLALALETMDLLVDVLVVGEISVLLQDFRQLGHDSRFHPDLTANENAGLLLNDQIVDQVVVAGQEVLDVDLVLAVLAGKCSLPVQNPLGFLEEQVFRGVTTSEIQMGPTLWPLSNGAKLPERPKGRDPGARGDHDQGQVGVVRHLEVAGQRAPVGQEGVADLQPVQEVRADALLDADFIVTDLSPDFEQFEKDVGDGNQLARYERSPRLDGRDAVRPREELVQGGDDDGGRHPEVRVHQEQVQQVGVGGLEGQVDVEVVGQLLELVGLGLVDGELGEDLDHFLRWTIGDVDVGTQGSPKTGWRHVAF